MDEEKQEEQRELSFGEKAVGLTFNPSNNPLVDDLKRKAAAFIDACQNMRTMDDPAAQKLDGEIVRMVSIAITEAQTAQMWAVKAATFNK